MWRYFELFFTYLYPFDCLIALDKASITVLNRRVNTGWRFIVWEGRESRMAGKSRSLESNGQKPRSRINGQIKKDHQKLNIIGKNRKATIVPEMESLELPIEP